MNKELFKKLSITGIFCVTIFILSFFKNPAIDSDVISLNKDFLNAFSAFSYLAGLSFDNLAITMLGISPIITASIVIQLLSVASKRLKEFLSDKDNKKKSFILNISLIFILALSNAYMFAFSVVQNGLLKKENEYEFIMWLLIGTALLYGISLVLDKFGLLNGISTILFVNIASKAPFDLVVVSSFGAIATAIFLCVIAALLFVAVVYNTAYIKINITNTNRTSAMPFKRDFIPLKLSSASVMPIIYVSSFISFISLIFSFFNVPYALKQIFSPGLFFNNVSAFSVIGIIVYIGLTYLFLTFQLETSFDTREVSENLKKKNSVINGIRPGKETAAFLDKKLYLVRNNAFVFLLILCVLPLLIMSFVGLSSLSLPGTSLIIITSFFFDFRDKIKMESVYIHGEKHLLFGR